MSNMVITVSFVVSTSITDALREAKEKALQWDVAVEFRFNKVEFFVTKNADLFKMEQEYLKSNNKFICG